MNILYQDEIKNFATEIIKKANKTSTEKLLDENDDYTEYGEYVIELMAPSIAKYAFLKSLTGDKLKTKILPSGEITYDYVNIKEITSLMNEQLNIEINSNVKFATIISKIVGRYRKNNN